MSKKRKDITRVQDFEITVEEVRHRHKREARSAGLTKEEKYATVLIIVLFLSALAFFLL